MNPLTVLDQVVSGLPGTANEPFIREVAKVRELLAETLEYTHRLHGLRELCGHVQDGSCQSVTISQDDATRAWTVSVNRQHYASGETFEAAIDAAVARSRESQS